jgi:GT2 family glycosyltransferase
MQPAVNTIIVNWNHRNYLESCLKALKTQTYPTLEITIVDNGSVDGSVEWLTHYYPGLQLLAFSENAGFSRAFNYAVKSTTHPFILSLNPDVVVQPGFVAELIQTISEDDRIGVVTPKLLRADDPAFLDSTGLFIDRRRRPYDRGQLCTDRGQFDNLRVVFGACGAAALYRRTMLEDLAYNGEYFDEDFFAYYEDVDLAWRAQARGWQAIYTPRAIAAHVRGWGDTIRKSQERREWKGPRLALCNRYLTIVKNDTLHNLILDIPLILAAEIPRLVYFAMRKPSLLLGIVDFFQKLPSIWRKRRQIRHRQLIGDDQLRHWFMQSHYKGKNSVEASANLL